LRQRRFLDCGGQNHFRHAGLTRSNARFPDDLERIALG
jgi:hypothetical protein